MMGHLRENKPQIYLEKEPFAIHLLPNLFATKSCYKLVKFQGSQLKIIKVDPRSGGSLSEIHQS